MLYYEVSFTSTDYETYPVFGRATTSLTTAIRSWLKDHGGWDLRAANGSEMFSLDPQNAEPIGIFTSAAKFRGEDITFATKEAIAEVMAKIPENFRVVGLEFKADDYLVADHPTTFCGGEVATATIFVQANAWALRDDIAGCFSGTNRVGFTDEVRAKLEALDNKFSGKEVSNDD